MKKVIKPSEGLIVRDPITKQPLPDEGKEIEMTTHWIRRLASGDVVEVSKTAELPLIAEKAKK
jgi:hypothetical protein